VERWARRPTTATARRASTSTLTSPLQGVLGDDVFTTSITAHWTAFGNTSGANTAEGYRLEASSTAFDGTGQVYFSSTTDVTQSTLSVTGLTTSLQYSLRAGALNHNQVVNWSWFKTETTGAGAAPGNPLITQVYVTSATVTYGTVAGNTGYILTAYSDGGYVTPVKSSVTYDVSLSTLSFNAGDLTANTTYWLRAGSLWAGGTTSYANTTPVSTSTLVDLLTSPMISQVYSSSASP
jgi:hypothetical protein